MKIKIALLLAVLLSVLTGCTTTEKFSVHTAEGTKVFTPSDLSTPAGTVSGGDVKIELSSDGYTGYLLLQPHGSDQKIPVGLDYKNNYHAGTKAAKFGGYVLAGPGIGTMVIGGIWSLAASKNEDEENSSLGAIVAGIGGATAAIGCAIGIPASSRLNQLAYEYNFGYEKHQTYEIPHLSRTLLKPNPPKNAISETRGISSTRKRATSGNAADTSQPAGPLASKASKSRSDYGKKIAGEYTGTGILLQGRDPDERYSEISLIIKRIDKSHVSVRVIESDEDFFDSPLTYVVKPDKNGGYILTIDGIPEATISVTKKGRLTFRHKKVNIDNQIYTLEIHASPIVRGN